MQISFEINAGDFGRLRLVHQIVSVGEALRFYQSLTNLLHGYSLDHLRNLGEVAQLSCDAVYAGWELFSPSLVCDDGDVFRIVVRFDQSWRLMDCVEFYNHDKLIANYNRDYFYDDPKDASFQFPDHCISGVVVAEWNKYVDDFVALRRRV